MAALARAADRVAVEILTGDYPDIDIVLEVENLRATAQRMFPGREALFRMVYEARFRRLWEQFRDPAGAPF